jgi:hypothetical protein
VKAAAASAAGRPQVCRGSRRSIACFTRLYIWEKRTTWAGKAGTPPPLTVLHHLDRVGYMACQRFFTDDRPARRRGREHIGFFAQPRLGADA